jgi:radical SAM protein with 4Fe4S-binding SPASM domain
MFGFEARELLELAWEKPILAQIEITSRCNQNCSFCHSGYKSAVSDSDLKLEDWQTILRKLRNIGVRRVDFTGRESFLSQCLPGLVSYCKELGLEAKINTNGTLDVSCVLTDVDEIVFSVHGIGKTHDEIVGYPGSFDLVEANIGRTVAASVRASINMSLVRGNYHEMLDVFRYFDGKYGIHKFAPSIPVPSLLGNAFADVALAMSSELLKDYLAKLKAIPPNQLMLKHGFHSIFISERDHYLTKKFPLPNCAAGKYKLVVESNGRVYPCNFFKSEEFYCGNILTGDESAIWKTGNGFRRFRELVLLNQVPQQCNGCLKKLRCYSGCRAWSKTYLQGGFEYARDRRCQLGSAFIGT